MGMFTKNDTKASNESSTLESELRVRRASLTELSAQLAAARAEVADLATRISRAEDEMLSGTGTATTVTELRGKYAAVAHKATKIGDELGEQNRLINRAEGLLRDARAQDVIREREVLVSRHKAASLALAEALVSAAAANAELEALHAEAFQRFPHGPIATAPPPCFYAVSPVGWLSIQSRGPILGWLEALEKTHGATPRVKEILNEIREAQRAAFQVSQARERELADKHEWQRAAAARNRHAEEFILTPPFVA